MSSRLSFPFTSPSALFTAAALAACCLGAAGCGPSPAEAAEQAYLGLDAVVPKIVDLALAGRKAATSASMPDEETDGAFTGTMLLRGQVQKPTKDSAKLTLVLGMAEYCDDGKHSYDTDSSRLPAVSMQIDENVTFTGTLTGEVTVSDALHGPVTLDLSFDGKLAVAGEFGALRSPNATHVHGTSQFGGVSYAVDVTK
jgi:hypothetical protein